VDGTRILIVITNGAQPIEEEDITLLLHHLKATLGRLLPELDGPDRIELYEQVRMPGPDVEEAFTHLAELI
jgi:hypothetical protein